MRQEEIIQKLTEETLKNDDSVRESLVKELAGIEEELKYCEKDLLDLGFDPVNPDLIPQFKDEQIQIEYMNLLNTRADLIKRKNTVSGDIQVYHKHQEN